MACLREGGRPQVGEVTRLSELKKIAYVDIQSYNPGVKFEEVVGAFANLTWAWSRLGGLPHL